MEVRIIDRSVAERIFDTLLNTATSKSDPFLLDLETANNIEWKQKRADRFVQVRCTYDEIKNSLLFPAYVHALAHHYFYLMCFVGTDVPVEILDCLGQVKKLAASTVIIPKPGMGNQILMLIGVYPNTEGTDLDTLICKLF